MKKLKLGFCRIKCELSSHVKILVNTNVLLTNDAKIYLETQKFTKKRVFSTIWTKWWGFSGIFIKAYPWLSLHIFEIHEIQTTCHDQKIYIPENPHHFVHIVEKTRFWWTFEFQGKFLHYWSTSEAYYFKRALKEGILIFSPNIFFSFQFKRYYHVVGT